MDYAMPMIPLEGAYRENSILLLHAGDHDALYFDDLFYQALKIWPWIARNFTG